MPVPRKLCAQTSAGKPARCARRLIIFKASVRSIGRRLRRLIPRRGPAEGNKGPFGSAAKPARAR